MTIRAWGITISLVLLAAAAVYAVSRTGVTGWMIGGGVVYLVYLSSLSLRNGARFEFRAEETRWLTPTDPPEIRRAILEVCERTGRPIPNIRLMEMDVPGAMVGYRGTRQVLVVDPRLLNVVGPDGFRAIVAHEFGHFGWDIPTDAIRKFLPQTVGFGVFWTVVLTGQSPVIATAGSAMYLGLAPSTDRRARAVRSLCSLGVEPLLLAVNRYANRLEEYRADAYAARVVRAAHLADALYRVAAIATGDNDEDVTGPIPWAADRSLVFSLFATHPSIENRVEALGCDLPEWVRPYQPHVNKPRRATGRI